MRKYIQLVKLICLSLLLATCSKDSSNDNEVFENETNTVKQFELNISVFPEGSGTVSVESGMYNEGQQITFTAVPTEGYFFKSWTGAVSTSEQSFTITMDANKSITANFEELQEAVTYIVSEEVWSQNFMELDTTDYTIKFNTSITSNYDFEVGDIIVSTVDGGLLRRISESSIGNNELILSTDFVTIEEAFEELQEEGTFKLEPDTSDKDFWLSSGVNSSNKDSLAIFPITLSETLVDPNNSFSSIILNGTYDLDVDFTGSVDISLFKIKEFDLTYDFEQTKRLVAEFTSNGVFERERRIANIPCADIPLGPIIITPTIEIYAGVKANYGGTVQLGVTENWDNSINIAYNGEEWMYSESNAKSIEFDPVTMETSGDVKVYLEPKLTFDVYRTAGPYLDVELYGKLGGTISNDNLSYEGCIGAIMGAGVKADIIGVSLFDFNVQIIDFEECPLEGSTDISDSDSDSDGDGIPDFLDNCPETSNPEQADFDEDGIGDECDEDSDNDGVPDIEDLCSDTPQNDTVDSSGCPINNSSGSLVAFYPFSGNINDQSGNNYSLTPSGNVRFVNGHDCDDNSAINFNKGYLDNTEIPLNVNGEYSVSFWIKPDNIEASITGGQYLFDFRYSDADFEAATISLFKNKLYYSIYGFGSEFGTKDLENDKWYHCVVNHNSNNNLLNFYIDGELDMQSTFLGDFNLQTTPIRIGARSLNAISPAFASIDEVRIYDYSILPTEVLDIYNSEKSNCSFSISNPVPENGTQNVDDQIEVISWEADDSNTSLRYDVYFGTSTNPDLILENIMETYVFPLYLYTTLEEGTTYYWKVVAKDPQGNSVEGPLWSFSTEEGTTSAIQVETLDPTNITPGSVTLNGNVESGGNPSIDSRGFYISYSENSVPTAEQFDESVLVGPGTTGSFSWDYDFPELGVTINYRAYASSGQNIILGDVKTVKSSSSPPMVNFFEPSNNSTLNIGQQVTVSGSVTQEDDNTDYFSSISIKVNGNLIHEIPESEASNFSRTWDTSSLSPGNYTISIEAIDGFGDIDVSNRNIFLVEPEPEPVWLSYDSGIINSNTTINQPPGFNQPGILYVRFKKPDGRNSIDITKVRIGLFTSLNFAKYNLVFSENTRVDNLEGIEVQVPQNFRTIWREDYVGNPFSQYFEFDVTGVSTFSEYFYLGIEYDGDSFKPSLLGDEIQSQPNNTSGLYINESLALPVTNRDFFIRAFIE